MTETVLRMTLSDVARLADVARPVVSMWRKRPVPGAPFPTPVAMVAGREQFDALEIAAYLRRTGRGNTAVDPVDVAAHASLTQVGQLQPEVLVAGLTSLLAITSLTGAVLSELPVREVLALADEVDPDNSSLAREVRGLGGSLPALVAHAERLADASYSARAAFDLLVTQQTQSGMADLTPIALRPQAIDLVSRVARAVITEAGWQSPCLIDPTDGNGDLMVTTAEAMPHVPTVATILRDSWTARLVRRRLLVHDLPHEPVTVDGDGDIIATPTGDGRVHVLQVPPASHHRMDDATMIDLVGDLVVQLADETRVVVLGPASALTDPPSSPDADRARDAVLRSGRLRAAVRLPAKLVVAAPRQHLALWVLGPAHSQIPIAERATVVGDLSYLALDDDTSDDLVTDVIAALGDPATARGHAYRFCRPVETRRLIPDRRSLVSIPAVGASAGVTRVLGDLDHDRQCRVLRGTRIHPEHLVESGRLVIGPEELRGERPVGSRAVDVLTFPSDYPSAHYTEPGDVVFCAEQQGVAAWVDRDGGSVVLSPARPLRIITDPGHGAPPLVPDVIAADIAAAGRRGITDWKRWPIRTVPKDRRAALSAELDRRAERRATLLAALSRLDAETETLINDVIAGNPTVEPVETTETSTTSPKGTH